MQTAQGPLQVVHIEDDEVDAMAIARAFQKKQASITVHHASDGVMALDLLDQERDRLTRGPLVILLDLNMPRMDGIEFLKELRRNPHYKNTIVFVLTTSSDERDRSKAYEHHVAGYLLKGISHDSIPGVVELVLDYGQKVVFPALAPHS